MYLVDTNIIIGILRNKEEFINKYKIISEKSIPTKDELDKVFAAYS